MTHAILVVLALAAGGWYVYLWLRRHLGRQKFSPWRNAWRALVFAVPSGVLAVRDFGHSQLIAGCIVGLLPGLFLGAWGLRLTRVENTAEGRFYTPSSGFGAALFVIFLARLAYRVVALRSQIAFNGFPTPAKGQSALTNFIFELLAGYYIAYYLGLQWRYRIRPAEIAGDPTA